MDTGDQGTIFFPALTAYTFRQLTGCLEWEHSTWLGYEKTSTLLREDDAYKHRRREEDGCSFSWTLSGVNENGPPRLIHLNTWSPVDGALFGRDWELFGVFRRFVLFQCALCL